MQKYLLMLLSLISCVVYAENYPVDSTQISPPVTTPGKRGGFMLTSGSYSFYCVNSSPGCLYQVQSKLCPAAYNPTLTVSASSGGNGNGIKYIVLEKSGLMVANNTYWIALSQAYIDNSKHGRSPLGVSYTIYCT